MPGAERSGSQEFLRLGDLDGDDIADLAVGASFDDGGETDRGAVWVFSLTVSGSASLLQKISDTSGGFMGTLDDGGDQRGAVYLLELDGSTLTCGNAVLDPVEECDDGNAADFDGARRPARSRTTSRCSVSPRTWVCSRSRSTASA